MINNIYFLQFNFQIGHVIVASHKIRPLHSHIFFVCIKVSTRSIFNIFQYKPESKLDFGCIIQLVEHMILLFVQEWVVEGWHGEIKKSVSSFFKLWFNNESAARIRFFFQFNIICIF